MKHLIVCSDGTWQKITSPYPTNVVKLTQAIAYSPDNLIYYGEGIGTGNLFDRITGGLFGWGIDKNIQDAYRFLCLNYAPGDRIYLFGFSRGAYTVRSLVGLIRSIGMLPRQGVRKIPQAYQIYQDAKGQYVGKGELMRESTKVRELPDVAKFRQQMINEYGSDYREEIEITVLGCWDTVGALGIPKISWIPGFIDRFFNQKYQFHNTKLSSTVKFALHAIAIDERRKAFLPTQMKPDHDGQLAEVWFAGGHGGVGGGTFTNSPLSNIALLWMIESVAALNLGLTFDQHKIEDGVNINASIQTNDDLKSPLFKGIRSMPSAATLHESVYHRWHSCRWYRPHNLVEYHEKVLNDYSIDLSIATASTHSL
jgi:uncharacterized protein (DUF2235 family)